MKAIMSAVTVAFLPVLLVGCGGTKPSSPAPTPTAPTVVTPQVSIQTVQATPDGTGVQHNTDFQFVATGSFPTGTQFTWQFGDGTSAITTVPTANRIYSQTGSFGVTVEARAGSSSAAGTRQVSVRSLVGRWTGTITGHTGFPRNRPIPITSFELTVNSQTLDRTTLKLSGSWADSAGCRETRAGFINQLLNPRPTAGVSVGVESLLCNDGDFYLTGIADSRFDRIDGTCTAQGGPNCAFRMNRQ